MCDYSSGDDAKKKEKRNSGKHDAYGKKCLHGGLRPLSVARKWNLSQTNGSAEGTKKEVRPNGRSQVGEEMVSVIIGSPAEAVPARGASKGGPAGAGALTRS